jgi:hypothetical protein
MKLKDILESVMGDCYKCWWLDKSANLIKVEDHLNGSYKILGNIDITDISDVYEKMYSLGFIRVMKNPYKSEISFEYNPQKYQISNKQLSALKNLAIENKSELYNDVGQKYISLLEEKR